MPSERGNFVGPRIFCVFSSTGTKVYPLSSSDASISRMASLFGTSPGTMMVSGAPWARAESRTNRLPVSTS